MANNEFSAFPESPQIELDEIKTECECGNPIWFDDSAFGLGWRCVKCGHKQPEYLKRKGGTRKNV